ncbi:MAG: 2-amino-4-hydroxy-6-hydroxymethyldihydropteridine diphosphokinase [Pseudomonadota bacterium]
MILISLGGNLYSDVGSPQQTLSAALTALPRFGVTPVAISPWFESDAWPDPAEPAYVNAAAIVSSPKPASEILAILHRVEWLFGRRRRVRWEPRPIDLDLLDYHGKIVGNPASDSGLVLPHPRAHERAFVLVPLLAVAPDWVHPRLGLRGDALLAGLPRPWGVRPLDRADTAKPRSPGKGTPGDLMEAQEGR